MALSAAFRFPEVHTDATCEVDFQRTLRIPDDERDYPFALKVATGTMCAITGDAWVERLNRDPQDYLVVPEQPWLDGYCVAKGVIRLFVAMPLGDATDTLQGVASVAAIGAQNGEPPLPENETVPVGTVIPLGARRPSRRSRQVRKMS